MMRSLLFGVYGYFNFTKQAFDRAQLNFNASALDVDLGDRVCVVTGANSGIGKATATAFAARGATVHLVCRNRKSAEEAVAEIKTIHPNAKLFIEIADVSSKASVASLASRISRIDVLVNNAGVLLDKKEETAEGVDQAFATNVLGPYLLTRLLIDKLENGRVVTVSSGGAYTTPLVLNQEDTRDGTRAYAQGKRAQIEMTNWFAKKYPKTRFYSMHPGWAETPGVQKSLPEFNKQMQGKLRTAEEGADTVVWAAISREVLDIPSGSFLFDRRVARQHLPLAFTSVSQKQVDDFMEYLNKAQ